MQIGLLKNERLWVENMNNKFLENIKTPLSCFGGIYWVASIC